MKKRHISSSLAAVGLVAATGVQAQGRFTFAGAHGSLSTTGAPTSPSSAYDYGLYVGPTIGSIASTPILTLQAGGIGIGMINSLTLTIDSQPPGTAEYFVIKGWSASLGVGSYEAALAGSGNPAYSSAFAGVSPVGFVTLTGGAAINAPGAALFGVLNVPGVEVNIAPKSLVLSPITSAATVGVMRPGPIFAPEPSTFALGGLGGGAWLAARWRRK